MIGHKVLEILMVLFSVLILILIRVHHNVFWITVDILMFLVLGFGGFLLFLETDKKVS